MTDPTRIRFLQVWGHPTRNEIYGPSDGVVIVGKWAADKLVEQGVAEYAGEEREQEIEIPGA